MCRWGGPSTSGADDDAGTPPPEHMLQGATYDGGVTDSLSNIRTAASDASTLSKGDSALDLAYCDEASDAA